MPAVTGRRSSSVRLAVPLTLVNIVATARGRLGGHSGGLTQRPAPHPYGCSSATIPAYIRTRSARSKTMRVGGLLLLLLSTDLVMQPSVLAATMPNLVFIITCVPKALLLAARTCHPPAPAGRAGPRRAQLVMQAPKIMGPPARHATSCPPCGCTQIYARCAPSRPPRLHYIHLAPADVTCCRRRAAPQR